MKFTKRLFALLMVAAMVLTYLPAVPVTVQAATSGYYTYEVSNGEATIVDCDINISGYVTIPSTLGGYPVTGIGASAFDDCVLLNGVTIPDSVTSIGNSAFECCLNLINITIPDSVTSIGASAFKDCHDLTSIIIPDSVANVGDEAFHNCIGLESVTILEGVTTIGDSAFYNCYKLTGITIPDSVTSIGNGAFECCTSLTSVTIGNGVTSIGSYAFYDCSSLTGVYISDIAAWCNIDFYSEDSNPLKYAHKLYLNGQLVTDLEIPSSVTSIGGRAFYNCISLTSATIPDGVTTIGDFAFYNCYNLTSITIPDSVTSIGAEAFNWCSGLKTITLPNGITSIEYGTFANCVSLTSATIPDSVTAIGDLAFMCCYELTSIVIPDSVTTIGDSAFFYCSSMNNITIGSGVTYIGISAFIVCDSLTDIYYRGSLPQWNAIYIGEDNYPLTVANIHYTEEDSTEPTEPEEIIASGTCGDNLTWTLDDEGLFTISGTGEMWVYDELSNDVPWWDLIDEIAEVVIISGVTSVGDWAFPWCDNLKCVTIPESVTSIGYYAFTDCYELDTVYYAGSEVQWNEISIANGNQDLTSATIHYTQEEPTEPAVPSDGDYIKITSAEAFTSGTYVIMVDTGYAMGVLDGTWISFVQPTVNGDVVTNPAGGIWTLTVDGDTVKITDANGVTIAPKAANTNGLASGDFAWNWTFEDGVFTFTAEAETVRLAQNIQADKDWTNKFRAYKLTTLNGSYAADYLTKFTLYKLTDGSEPEPTEPEVTEPTEPTEPEIPENSTVVKVTADKSEVYRGDEVTVTVSLEGDNVWSSIGYLPLVDNDYFTVISGEPLITGMLSDWSNTDGGVILQNRAAATQGDIFRFVIKIKDTAPFNAFTVSDAEYTSLRNGATAVATVLKDAKVSVLCRHDGNFSSLGQENHRVVCNICGETVTEAHDYVEGKCIECGEYKDYIVIFQYEDGTVISQKFYYYGDVVTAPTTPAVPEALGEHYQFDCWDKEITTVTGDTTYTALFTLKYIRGDMNDDGVVSDADAQYLLRHTLFGNYRYPIVQPGDLNGDGQVTDGDAMYLLWAVLFPERFPLH